MYQIIENYLSFEGSSLDVVNYHLQNSLDNGAWILAWKGIKEETDRLTGDYYKEQEKIEQEQQRILLDYHPVDLGERFLTEEELKVYINEFNYKDILSIVSNKAQMKQLYISSKNNYEKTEIFRIMLKKFGLLNINPVIEEFINEEFHIENAYVFQLDPYSYNLVPNYIVEMCDSIVNRIEDTIPAVC